MELFLLRHAKSDHDPSKWKTDAERPLSKKGISRQNHCAIGMSKLDLTINKAWVSPYRSICEYLTTMGYELPW